jgi:FkbM family methyltransferase
MHQILHYNNNDAHAKRFLNGFYDTEINFYKSIINQYSNPVFFDVGANIGYIATSVSPLCYSVHCFEPVQYNFPFLEQNANLFNNIRSNMLGINVQSEFGEILLSSKHHQGHSCDIRIQDKFKGIFSNKKERIQFIRLDEYINTNNIDYITLLKVDCEGLEKESIISLGDCINIVEHIIFETYFDEDLEVIKKFAFNFDIIKLDIRTGGPLYHMVKKKNEQTR